MATMPMSRSFSTRTRFWTAATVCAAQAGVTPTFKRFVGTEAQAKAYVRKKAFRQHLTTAAMSKLSDERIERVAAARRQGQSTRQIAEAEKVSHTQVRRDPVEATGSGVTGGPVGGK